LKKFVVDSFQFLENSTILSVLNLVLSIELTATCCCGMYQAWTMGEATSGKITELALYTTILLGMDTARKIYQEQASFLIKISLTVLRNKTLEKRIL
jgi:hypothetical protein